jgi:hypothetical protein
MILGQHSVRELQILLAHATRETNGLGKAFAALLKHRHDVPTEWRQKWQTDYQKLKGALTRAKLGADAQILAHSNVPGLNPVNVPAEPEYSAVRNALAGMTSLRTRLATAGVGGSHFGADPGSFPAVGTVTTGQTGDAGRLKVRAAPSAQGAQVGKFAHGQTVTITGPSVAGFFPVTGMGEVTTTDARGAQGSLQGFSGADFITPLPAAVAIPTPQPQAGEIPAATPPRASGSALPTIAIGTPAIVTTSETGDAGRLKVRSGPSTSAGQVGKFAHGAAITIQGPLVSGFFPVSGTGEVTTTDVRGAQGPLAGFVSASLVTPTGQSAPGNVIPAFIIPPPQAGQIPLPPQAPPGLPSAPIVVAPIPGPGVTPNLGLPKPSGVPTPSPAAATPLPQGQPSSGPITPTTPLPPGLTPVPASQQGPAAAASLAPSSAFGDKKNLLIAGGIAAVLGVGIYAATRKPKRSAAHG